ncbi:precorrin-4 C(11)-methyltransferase [Pectinatus cerevisiiphilus]|uniref:Cobalt-precorrin 4 C11-methyltransferase n=1 Tax=Pectinatus cerevisiiphilus TaxID=86956 RepID=A0A4R3K3G8_9FIRM|nr:precorrin-4 C(11)-methyltransferase [Pectinatus cerevisiiphilus]TCS77249.1 cobalt-precorrin 4 C11-methyltransferase [Pectinatus cerevisiiphilus]
MNKVYIVGAGPGDPELITVKGQRLLQCADVIIYAGSLVNPALLDYAKPDCQIYNSASMTLDEVIHTIEKAVSKNLNVVRLHTGDPAIYGAIQEQMDALKKLAISFEVIPGVSSFLASAAALKQEYTLPEISQTVIITRNAGRTPVPERESLKALAAHKATMCIFLSVHMLDEVVKELTTGGYSPDTPIAVVQKASWPEQKIVRGHLNNIAAKVKDQSIDRTAMIVVGNCLESDYALSRLYAPEFTHMYRKGTSAKDK